VSTVSNVSLILATLELQQTQLLLAAIRTADIQSHVNAATGTLPGDQYCPGTISPSPRYLPREVIHPTPRYLPRPVLHPTPRVEPQPPVCPTPKIDPTHITPGPQPPWKVLPWQEPTPPADVIKITLRQPDIVGKGNLIDLFV
jgi:hypothetical protein